MLLFLMSDLTFIIDVLMIAGHVGEAEGEMMAVTIGGWSLWEEQKRKGGLWF